METIEKYDKIKNEIHAMADNIFFAYQDIDHSNEENIMSIYAKVCSALLIVIKHYVDDMNETGQSIFKCEFTDNDMFNKWAFSACVEKQYTDDECLKMWKSMRIELPFNFVSTIMEQKGYHMRVTEKTSREDLYAPVVTSYTMEIIKNRNRCRDDYAVL